MASRLTWLPLALLVLSLSATSAGSGCGSSSDQPPASDDGGSDGTGGDDSSLFGDGTGQALVVEPKAPTLTVTGPGATEQFTAHFAGDSTPLQATWTIDVANIGTIDQSGLFSASGLMGGQ
ncbi:MAG TPA: hypothetical protein VIF09_11710, partial [Polyangiaceae bacterium]